MLVRLRSLMFTFLFVFIGTALLAESPSCVKAPDGTSHAIKLEVVSGAIIRVIESPCKKILPTQSLIAVYKKKANLSWQVIPSEDFVTNKTQRLIAMVNLHSGTIIPNIYRGADASFHLYEAEGTNYNYEKDAYSYKPHGSRALNFNDKEGERINL
ncbi:hypothetical protein [Arachidicoccus sp.]|uniref:hypothetical protein n=1 Tax=Arachidicoccus sp. TaxID=1872624 RepID=UPI003D257790